jgi:aspartyl-tRNA(Asn)/glutamyl-tRNA(Gln) amidotransferase subunit C
MPVRVDRDLVKHIAQLSRLSFDKDRATLFAAEMSSILEFIDELSSVDTDGVPPTENVRDVTNVLRDDEVRPSISVDRALSNAPSSQNGCFKVPKVLGASGGAERRV